MGYITCKKLVTEDVHNEFIEMVLNFATNNKMTATNILDAVETVVSHMMDNALMEEDTDENLQITANFNKHNL